MILGANTSISLKPKKMPFNVNFDDRKLNKTDADTLSLRHRIAFNGNVCKKPCYCCCFVFISKVTNKIYDHPAISTVFSFIFMAVIIILFGYFLVGCYIASCR